MRRLISVLVVFTLCESATAQTPETGAIVGRAVDAGSPVAGATVEARSPALPGVRSQQTDHDGAFRLRLLPPGNYTLTVSSPGFTGFAQTNVAVNLGHTVTITAPLQPKLSQEITVSGNAPAVDVTATTSGVNIPTDVARTFPLARNYSSATSVAPGVRNDGTGPAVYGSTGLENQFVIDGLNVTDMGTGMQLKNVTLDFVDELEVMTGGLSAEYGRMTGGIINAVTKSGSNELTGSAFGYTSSVGMNAKATFPDQMNKLYWSGWSQLDHELDGGVNAGGPIVRDKLWAFGAFDSTRRRDGFVQFNAIDVPGYSIPAGASLPQETNENLRSLKLTYALSSHETLTASMFGDPGSFAGTIHLVLGPPSTWRGTYKSGGDDYVGRYAGIFGGRAEVGALFGRNVETTRFVGMNITEPVVIDQTVAPRQRSGGFGGYNNGSGKRDVTRIDTTLLLAHGHNVKIGVDQERALDNWQSFFSGGAKVEKYCTVKLVKGACPATAPVYYRHTAWVDDLLPGFDAKDRSTYAAAIANPLIANDLTTNRSFYVQDSWTTNSVTINAGLRIERQVLTDRRRATQLAVNNPAPRLGVIWDPRRDGRSRLYAFYGRYFESLPTSLNSYFSSAPQVAVNNFSADPTNFTPDPAAPAFATTRTQVTLLGGSSGTRIDPETKGQYLDETILGYDREIGSTFTGGIKASFRNTPRIIDDMSSDPANYSWVIANPGLGEGSKFSYVDGELVAPPKPVRRNASVELHVSRRFSGSSQLIASYVWSRLYGNYEGLYQSEEQLYNINGGTAFDYADFLINAYGPLPQDRTHQLKAYGSHQVSNGFASGLVVGAAARWYSGTPLSVRGVDWYGFNSSFLQPRGSLGRGPSEYEADVHLGYPVPVRRTTIELLIDVFNVLNRQGATQLDTMYSTYIDGPCAGVPADICDASTGALKHNAGTLEPVGRLRNPRATAPNEHFLKASAWTAPRQIRVGARVRF